VRTPSKREGGTLRFSRVQGSYTLVKRGNQFFSLFAEPNPIVIGSLFIFALSAAGAIFLVLEMGQPFSGLMQISDAPLRSSLAPLHS